MVVQRAATLTNVYDVPHREALEIIQDSGYYIEDHMIYKDYDMEFLGIARWVLKELCVLVASHPTEPPLVVLEDFRDKFSSYSKSCIHESNVYFCDWVVDITDFVIDRFM